MINELKLDILYLYIIFGVFIFLCLDLGDFKNLGEDFVLYILVNGIN